MQENEIYDDDLTVYVAVNDRLAGIIRFAVSPRDDAPEIFAHLKHLSSLRRRQNIGVVAEFLTVIGRSVGQWHFSFFVF